MENDLSIFLTTLKHQPVIVATNALVVLGAVYAMRSSAGLDNTSSMVSGLITSSIFTYLNTVNVAKLTRDYVNNEFEALNTPVMT
jgi:hypothetical protein